MGNGWIKIHRKLTDWEWYKDKNTCLLFLHLLLKSNHKPNTWKGILINTGQVLTGRKALSYETALSEQEIRTSLINLQSTNNITIKTTNKYSVITILNWENYQHEQPTITKKSRTPATTNKNEKKMKKKEEDPSAQSAGTLGNETINLFRELNPSYERLFHRKTQHEAAERLVAVHGFEQLRRVILFIGSRRADQYCPTITTPIQLEEKWSALEKYGLGLKSGELKSKPRIWV